MRLFATAAAASLLAAGSLSSQVTSVVINEVNAVKGESWVEIYNRGTTDVDMGKWSIYHATKSPNQPGDYWFAIPIGTKIKAKDYVRILWGTKIQSNPDPREIYTGDSNFNFLFGHGYEQFDPAQGAVAICTTQDNQRVNDPNVFLDWWQWGATGFPRENLAVGNKPVALWQAGKFAAAIPTGASLMVLDHLNKLPHDLDAYRFDYSPTPLLHNAEPVGVTKIGVGCGVLKTVDIELDSEGLSFHGNKDFKLVVKETQGPAFFETMFFIVNLGKLASWGACTVLAIDLPGFTTPFQGTDTGSTTLGVPLTIPSTQGLEFYVQTLVFSPAYYSFSNRIKIQLSK